MKYCIFCGAVIEEEHLYCTQCGKRQKMCCPYCGHENDASNIYCQKCGKTIQGAHNKQGAPTEGYTSTDYDENNLNENRKPYPLWGIVIAITLLGSIGAYITHQNSIKEKQIQEKLVADSIDQERIKALAFADSVKKAKQDSIDFVKFTSPDLNIFGLHGHVRRTTIKYPEDIENVPIIFCAFKNLAFSYNGELEVSGNIERQNKRITKISTVVAYYKEKFDIDFKYSNGKIRQIDMCPEWGSVGIATDYYEWDSNNRISTIDAEVGNHAGGSEMSWNFTYKEFDNYGNWTTAEANFTEDWTSVAGEEYNSYTTRTVVIKRIIDYYSKQ